MKLSDYYPQVPSWIEKQERLDNLLEFAQSAMLSKSEGETFRGKSFGIDNLAYLWSKQYTQNRAQMLNDLFAIASTVAEIRAPILHVRNEVFRRGVEWYAKFNLKCKNCNAIYYDEVKECGSCGGSDFRKPDSSQKDVFIPFMDDMNLFDQSLIEICKQLEWDINVVDELYLYIVKEYYDDGKHIRSKPIEIRRLNPAYVEIDLDAKGMPKSKHWFCLIHRDQVKEFTDVDAMVEAPTCPVCERELVPAMWKYFYRGTSQFLLANEVCHASKFEINEIGGFSPILTIFEKALTLIGMDKVAFKYFFERKMPASILMVFTDDTESLRRERESVMQQLSKSPDYIPMMAVSAKTGSRGRAELLRLFHTFAEMDYMPIKNEIRERIAALWGVTPIWQSASGAVGGVAAQTAQLVVTSRVVESDQSIFNDKIFPFMLDAFGITDWGLRLRVPEEKAEATRIQFAQQRTSVANQLHMMGFEVKLKPGVKSVDDVDFVISGEATKQDPMGGMGGMLGGMGGPEGAEGGSPFAFSDDKGLIGWAPQIQKAGYTIDSIEDIQIASNGSWVSFIFKSLEGELMEAKFTGKGSLIGINRCQRNEPGLHSHEGYESPHLSDMPHNTMTRRGKNESRLLNSEDDED